MTCPSRVLRRSLATVLCLFALPERATPDPRVGTVVDVAPFGVPLAGKKFLGVEWDNPREVAEVRTIFPDAAGAPPAESLRLEWWGSVWPANGVGGWMKLDDPWNGDWVRAPGKGSPGPDAASVAFTFPPLTKEEWKNALAGDEYPDKKPPAFRKTLKVRVVSDAAPLPDGTRLAVLGRSTWREGLFDIDVRLPHEGEAAARLEVLNGEALGLDSLPPPRGVSMSPGRGWTARGVAGGSAGVRLRLLYADAPHAASNDLTRVTVRMGSDPAATGFSFVPQDVLREGSMRLPDLGVLVSETGRALTHANDPGPAAPRWERTVRRRIPEQPETSRESALAGIPRLAPPQWVPLGVPSARQEVFVGPHGDWSMWGRSLHTDARDSERIPFREKKKKREDKLDATLDTSADPQFNGADREGIVRSLEADSLPLIHAEWKTGPIRYRHSLLAAILLGDISDDETRRGDETVVLLSKLEVTNASGARETATVHLRWSHDALLSLQDDGLVAIRPADASAVPAGLTALRGLVSADRPAGGGAAGWTLLPPSDKPVGAPSSSVLRWQGTLEPGQTRALYFKEPFVDLLDAVELEKLRRMRFEEEASATLGYWRSRLEGGMRLDVPEPALQRFYDANLWHIAITTDRDPQTGLYNQGVATWAYKVFANETVMIARSMDMRGEHKEAERFLEPMLRYQGHEALTGRYSTKEDAFHSAGAYTHGQYAMNHGFTLWGIADHYLMTRDRAYLERVAPQVVKGCDFLIRERRATMTPEGQPRSPVHGLSPASSLEDVVEFQYWFATNGYFYLGLKRVAEALADIGHPDAARIAVETERYRRDIETSAREAATRAAAVRLRDGNWVPYAPSRVFQWRHLTEGWIREALYPALHLATTEVLPPDDPLMTWMLDDLEDNIFYSKESGYGVQDVEKRWFERGAVTLQPCLLDTPTLYMARDEVPAALRSFWNTYALLLYPDVQCFAEWAPSFGKGGGPLYKTSDEARFVMWLRQLLVWEDGDRLWLARGTPRAWLEDGKTVRVERAPTFFGTAGVLIRSEAAQGRIRATVTLPTRNPPREAWLRLRHPEGKLPVRVAVNGRPVEPERVVGEDIRLLPGAADAAGQIEVMVEY